VAVAALAFGGFETVRWQSGVKDFNNHLTNGSVDCQTAAPQRGGSACQTLYDKYTSNERLAVIGFAAGGALSLTALGLVIFSPSHSSPSERVGLACAPNLQGPGVSCRMSF